MLDACLVNQKWDDLEFFYTKMLQHGYYFNADRQFTFILSDLIFCMLCCLCYICIFFPVSGNTQIQPPSAMVTTGTTTGAGKEGSIKGRSHVSSSTSQWDDACSYIFFCFHTYIIPPPNTTPTS
ncbi:hypothetical protein Hanom_Chr16g01429091 [Helianthus anomalus]